MYRTKLTWAAGLVTTLCLLALSCRSGQTPIKARAYAPSFQYLSKKKLRGHMIRMAERVTALEQALGDAKPAERNARVRTALAGIKQIVQEIQGGATQTNHPKLDANLDRFSHLVDSAIDGAEREPPVYFFAGSISGACRYCHH